MAPPLRIESQAIAFPRGERVRRRLRRLAPLFLVLVVLARSVTLALGLHRATFWLVEASALIAVVGGLLYVFSGSRRGRRAPGAIEVKDGALVIHRGPEERTIPLGDLEQGWPVQPSGVGLRARDGREVLADVSRAEAEALLQATGLDAASRVLRVSIASAASQRAGGEVLGIIGIVFALPLAAIATLTIVLGLAYWLLRFPAAFLVPEFLARGAVLVLLTAIVHLVAAGLWRFLRRREVVIGTDGVVVPGFARGRFVPHREVAGVERDGFGVVLRLRDGRAVPLPVRARSLGPLPLDAPVPDAAPRELLFERIRDAMSVRAGPATSRAIDELDRRGMPVPAWRERLRGLLAKEGSYRAPGIDGAALRTIVADPDAPAERRVAAAVALSKSDDADDRRQVRIAVEACADAELRAALEEAAEGEIDERRLGRMASRPRA